MLKKGVCGSALNIDGQIPLVPLATEIVPKASFVVKCGGFEHEDLIGRDFYPKKVRGDG